MSQAEVLLVEDSEGDIEMTKRALVAARPACTLTVAHDGVEALEVLKDRNSSGGAPLPSLILLDINMPRMDGKQFLDVIKNDERTRHIPVVMLTSSSSTSDKDECCKRKADSYVVKPFDPRIYSAVVREIVKSWCNYAPVPASFVAASDPIARG